MLYVAEIMDKLMEHVTQQREVRNIKCDILRLCFIFYYDLYIVDLCTFSFQLSKVMVEMGSNLMQVKDQILTVAQKEKRACSSIIYSLETLAWPQLHSHAQDFSMVSNTFFPFKPHLKFS